LAFTNGKSPVFHRNVLVPIVAGRFDLVFRHWNGETVKVWSWFLTDQTQNRWRQIGVCGYQIGSHILRDSWSTDDEWNIDIFFECTLFAWLHAVMANVVSIVAGIENIGLVEYSIGFQTLHNAFDYLVNSLKSPKTIAEKMVIVRDVLFALTWQILNPRHSRCLVEMKLASCATVGFLPLTFSGLKLGVLGTTSFGKRCLCLSAGIGAPKVNLSPPIVPSPSQATLL